MIPNQWYAILRSQDVRRKPTAVRRMGRDLVIYRDRSGSLVCLDDRCPHKGAKLSLGRIQSDDTIQCPYHGFRFDTRGQCTLMPCIGREGRIPAGMCTTAYRVVDKYDYIWLWSGDDRPEHQLPEIPMFEDWRNHDGIALGFAAPVHYTRYVESVTDVYHLPYVHSGPLNIWEPRDGRVDDFRYEVNGCHVTSSFVLRPDDKRSTDETLKARRPWARGWRIGIELLMPNMILITSPVFDAMFIMTPIDDDNTWVMIKYHDLKRAALIPFLPSLPLPRLLKQYRALFFTWLECHYQQPKDMRIVTSQSPRVSEWGVNRFAAPDALNTQFLKLRDKLKAEAKNGALVQIPTGVLQEPERDRIRNTIS